MTDKLKLQGTNKEAINSNTIHNDTIHSGETRFSQSEIEAAIEGGYHWVCSGIELYLPTTALLLYLRLLIETDIRTEETPPMHISQIAEKMHRCERTVQKWLTYLIDEGLIKRVPCENKKKTSCKDISYFIVRGEYAERYVEKKEQVR